MRICSREIRKQYGAGPDGTTTARWDVRIALDEGIQDALWDIRVGIRLGIRV